MPTIGVVGGGSAGLAQFGIDVGVDWGCLVGWQDALVESGIGAWGNFSGAMQEMHSIGGAGCCRGMATGSGAGGGACRMTFCGVQSCCGFGHGFGCCGLSTYGRCGGTFGAGNGLLSECWKGCRLRTGDSVLRR